MALKSAWDEEIFNNLDGQLIYYEVRIDSFLVEKQKSEKQNHFGRKIKQKKQIHANRLYKKALIDISELGQKTINQVGTKAANFGELNKIDDAIVVPEAAFAIPFYWYKNHIATNEIDQLIQKLLMDEIFISNYDSLQYQLKVIRKAIKMPHQ